MGNPLTSLKSRAGGKRLETRNRTKMPRTKCISMHSIRLWWLIKIGDNYKQQFLLQHQHSGIECFTVRSIAYLPSLRIVCEFELKTKPKKSAVWLFQCSSESPPAFERRLSTLRPHTSSLCVKPVKGNMQQGESSRSAGWLPRTWSVLKGLGGRSAVLSESVRLLIVVQQVKKKKLKTRWM